MLTSALGWILGIIWAALAAFILLLAGKAHNNRVENTKNDTKQKPTQQQQLPFDEEDWGPR